MAWSGRALAQGASHLTLLALLLGVLGFSGVHAHGGDAHRTLLSQDRRSTLEGVSTEGDCQSPHKLDLTGTDSSNMLRIKKINTCSGKNSFDGDFEIDGKSMHLRSKDLIWEYTAEETGKVTLETHLTEIGESFDTWFWIAKDCSLDLTRSQVVANDDDGGRGTLSRLTFDAVEGQKYYIALEGYVGDCGPVEMTAHKGEFSPPPEPKVNDLTGGCPTEADPTAAHEVKFSYQDDHEGKVTIENINSCLGGNTFSGSLSDDRQLTSSDFVMKLEKSDQRRSIRAESLVTQYGVQYDSWLLVATACSTDMTEDKIVTDNDDISSFSSLSRVDFTAEPGKQYYVVLAGFRGNCGHATMRLTSRLTDSDGTPSTTQMGCSGLLEGSVTISARMPYPFESTKDTDLCSKMAGATKTYFKQEMSEFTSHPEENCEEFVKCTLSSGSTIADLDVDLGDTADADKKTELMNKLRGMNLWETMFEGLTGPDGSPLEGEITIRDPGETAVAPGETSDGGTGGTGGTSGASRPITSVAQAIFVPFLAAIAMMFMALKPRF